MNTTFETRYFAVRISPGPEALIEASGELDIASASTFQAAVRNLDLARHERVVLDLGRLAFMDAAGLHAVLDLHEECVNVSAALTILPGSRQVQRVFELTGADRLVRFRASGAARSARFRTEAPSLEPQEQHERRRE